MKCAEQRIQPCLEDPGKEAATGLGFHRLGSHLEGLSLQSWKGMPHLGRVAPELLLAFQSWLPHSPLPGGRGGFNKMTGPLLLQ